MMKVSAQCKDVDRVEVAVTVQMPLDSWKMLREHIQGGKYTTLVSSFMIRIGSFLDKFHAEVFEKFDP